MKNLCIDIETYSSNPITAGVTKYAAADDFEILLFGYAVDDGPVRVVDLASGEEIPKDVVKMLTDKKVLKTAYNAVFEMTCLDRWHALGKLPYPIDPEQWECDMVRAAYNGLPLSLAACGKALGLPEDKQKDARGKALIRYFCLPCRPTKANGGRTRNLPEHARDKWEEFIEYNRQDVVTERAIREKTALAPSAEEHALWVVDYAINRRGIGIDMKLVDNAMAISETHTKALTLEAVKLTKLPNPNSPAQLKGWLEDKGYELTSLNKEAVSDLLSRDIPDDVRRVLLMRQQLGKTSVKKYQAMKETVAPDGRAHNLFQFYGSRTGRWAGRNIQLQNLPRNYIKDLDVAREIVRAGDYELLAMLYDDVPDILSQLIRTALIPAKGNRFIVADFSAIEARVTAWVAGEKWRQEAFRDGKDIYCASASQMFGVPVEKHGRNAELRQKGKIAELALGYGGGVAALRAMGGDRMGLGEAEMQGIVNKWRAASPSIVRFWNDIEAAAQGTIATGKTRPFGRMGECSMDSDGTLVMTLPSGRTLSYRNAHIGTNRFGNDSIIYDGTNQKTKAWEPLETYGGKLTENYVQAIARDCLGAAMRNLETAGYKIVAHIHDEVVLDTNRRAGTLQDAISLMTAGETWSKGLLLDADGFESDYYKKD